ncbi:mannitol-1-phosphate 5-dehydrogenase [Melghirimyces profundicolus]|uniref:Mannitol-1-phosphate 5-dehydrogenase n=1 Tax=Melghirimyces profundicolus TaxID=1242148 RepID=A0A2T6BYY9_9BACL|nr:mannitol-1-phosphate 5-dehydrogenase [Melghirimyces profundicolus]PTX61283.1 mannitol-1-phosphate 5-dehydrogenase [Melghirimyces profundicolus]
MRAVHFGAGNIGRGFIGALLSHSGYHVCFVDVRAPLVKALKERGSYSVRLLGERTERMDVSGVTALDSRTEPERVREAVAAADIVTTAVGPTVLKKVAPLIAEGLRLRLRRNEVPLNVIACENMLGGSTMLKKEIAAHLSQEERESLEHRIGFPDAAVDRIVPVQTGTDPLEVTVEPFYEWMVDRKGVRGEIPPIEGITYVEELTPYIERKLYTVNTGHAVCAYTGRLLGHETIRDAMRDTRVEKIVTGALEETGVLLVAKHSFSEEGHRDYITRIMERFSNPRLTDPVARVGRSAIRKLRPTDRLVGPALQLTDHGLEPRYLAAGIAAALFFDDGNDPEAVELQQLLDRKGIAGTLQTIAGIPPNSSLTRLVSERYREWEGEKEKA